MTDQTDIATDWHHAQARAGNHLSRNHLTDWQAIHFAAAIIETVAQRSETPSAVKFLALSLIKKHVPDTTLSDE